MPPAAKGDSTPNAVLGEYDLHHELGRGGMGVVFMAIHRGLERPVALKVVSEHAVEDPATRRRFVGEALASAAIEHPNVVPVYEAGEIDDVLFIATRLISGGDLRAVVRAGPVPPAHTAELIAGIGEALDAAHQRGFIHRDVKPANVLVARAQPGHPYLTDFGIARHLDATRKTARGAFVGSVPYVSPEQIESGGGDHRADVYSLGCVMYELLTGTEPFPKDSDVAVLFAHMNDEPPTVPSSIPHFEALSEIVTRAMAKDPRNRFQSAGELGAAVVEAVTPSGRNRPPRARCTSVRQVTVTGDALRFGDRVSVSFQRTLRVPDDAHIYPLPPGFGRFPVHRVADFASAVPERWVAHGGIFIPMYQREALWLSFGARDGVPAALKIGVGKVNVISGERWDERIVDGRQDFIVCPQQLWLDGLNVGQRYIRQFVAMPLGSGMTVEAQITGTEEVGGIQIAAYEPVDADITKMGGDDLGLGDGTPAVGREAETVIAPQTARLRGHPHRAGRGSPGGTSAPIEMGLAVGGRITQEVVPDPYGSGYWHEEGHGRAFIHIVNSVVYRDIVGHDPPPTPITAQSYANQNLPWFSHYSDGDLDAAAAFSDLQSVRAQEKNSATGSADSSFDVPESDIHQATREKDELDPGEW